MNTLWPNSVVGLVLGAPKRHWSRSQREPSGGLASVRHSGILNTDGTPSVSIGVSAIHGMLLHSAIAQAVDPLIANRVPICTFLFLSGGRSGNP